MVHSATYGHSAYADSGSHSAGCGQNLDHVAATDAGAGYRQTGGSG
ncbi:hypothetical protein [Streptomyces sp. NRRL S-241]|nr:hypothetical protein [Streptomyces sp. NRRL S-241]